MQDIFFIDLGVFSWSNTVCECNVSLKSLSHFIVRLVLETVYWYLEELSVNHLMSYLTNCVTFGELKEFPCNRSKVWDQNFHISQSQVDFVFESKALLIDGSTKLNNWVQTFPWQSQRKFWSVTFNRQGSLLRDFFFQLHSLSSIF